VAKHIDNTKAGKDKTFGNIYVQNTIKVGAGGPSLGGPMSTGDISASRDIRANNAVLSGGCYTPVVATGTLTATGDVTAANVTLSGDEDLFELWKFVSSNSGSW